MLSRGLLLLAALLTLPGAAPKRPAPRELKPFEWPTPKLLQVVEVPGVIKAQGIPTQLRAVKLGVPLEEALQAYVDAFKASGFYLPPVRDQHQPLNVPMLTALDTRTLISYTVILQPNPDRTTTVLLGEANYTARDKPGQGVAPLMPGARNVITTDQEGSQVVAYEVSSPLAKARAFYDEALAGKGFVESSEPGEKGLYRKGGTQLQVRLREKGPEETAVFILSSGR